MIGLRARIRQWWLQRLPLTDTTTLTQRNVYILPTRPGFMLGATLLVLLVGAGAIRLGVPLDKFALTVMTLVAALPSASPLAFELASQPCCKLDLSAANPALRGFGQDAFDKFVGD